MDVRGVLAGNAGVEGIRWLLSGSAPRRALRRALCESLEDPDQLKSCRLRDARFQPGRKLVACYDVSLRPEGSRVRRVRAVAVKWKLTWIDRSREHRDASDLAAMEAEARRRGLHAPFRRLLAQVPNWGIRIQVAPVDPDFPQLIRMTDPRHMRSILADVLAPMTTSSNGARVGDVVATVVRYWPRQRHVLRYDCVARTKFPTVFAKIYRDDKGRRVMQAATKAAELFAVWGEAVTVVRPLAFLTEDNAILYPRASGRPLSEVLGRPSRDLGKCLSRAGEALRMLHRLPATVTGTAEFRTVASERGETARACQFVHVLCPQVAAAIDRLLDRAQELYSRLPAEAAGFTHGDFKAEHVWVNPGGFQLLDFDTCHLADPALDVGKFLADLRLWYEVFGLSGLEQAQHQFIAGYAAGLPDERLMRARVYEAVETVKMAARRVRLYDRSWATRTERLVAGAVSGLDRLEAILGLKRRRRIFHGGARRLPD